MNNIKLLLEQENGLRRIFGEPEVGPTDYDSIYNLIQFKLSPEILFADGERSQAEADNLYTFYMNCLRELKPLGYGW